MALVALEIPKVGLVMENARLVRWLKGVGDVVNQGDPLLELETEKSVVEIESTESGRLVDILLQVDQEVRVGDRIAWLENDVQGAAVGHGTGVGQDTGVGQGAAGGQGAAPAHGTAAASAPARSAASPTPGRIKSSPVARRLAAEQAIDLGRIVGTGPGGRVQLTDVRRAIDARSSPEAPPAGVQPLSSMRRALARSMTLSNATVPQFTVERAVDWTVLHTVRAKLLAELPAGEPRPSANDFLLLGIARALIRCPALNATFSGVAGSPDAGIVPANGA
ncbi:MAG: pdhC, partial [Gammaproteobacteria bacterium]|nr:pdhC [Gammaproteobacteria bacterium]